eukprot:CAMPEP_0170428324 /NCGR_PEP_ID=MMETSP0117_2-20130122/39708_1 /TAXON_ID=400756 /ORGANISM="Durinskia baltica, Strain CSIRO CS-38" /LENGTH=37 /DNA_ID= /DNA_START= /DNA_END= /DNA_ORIENTATION=
MCTTEPQPTDGIHPGSCSSGCALGITSTTTLGRELRH